MYEWFIFKISVHKIFRNGHFDHLHSKLMLARSSAVVILTIYTKNWCWLHSNWCWQNLAQWASGPIYIQWSIFRYDWCWQDLPQWSFWPSTFKIDVSKIFSGYLTNIHLAVSSFMREYGNIIRNGRFDKSSAPRWLIINQLMVGLFFFKLVQHRLQWSSWSSTLTINYTRSSATAWWPSG